MIVSKKEENDVSYVAKIDEEKGKIDIQLVDMDIDLDKYIKKSKIKKYKESDIVEGTVLSVTKNRILVDLGNSNYGLILGKEIRDINEEGMNIKEGDKVTAVVIRPEDPDGYVILSIRKISIQKTWDYLESIEGTNTILPVKIVEVNRGGLIFDYKGIRGFIPVSQLMPEHYPRVSEKDFTKIVHKLNKLKGQIIKTTVLAADRTQDKLILSEKKAYENEIEQVKSGLEVGKVYKGKVTGFSDFGIFVTFNGMEGLVHLSEISWGKVNDPRDFAKEGDEIDVMLIGFNNGRLSLSMKRLQMDPWIEMAKEYKKGQKVKGVVTRIEKYGYFVKLQNGLEGLVHLSQISWEKVDDISKYAKIGQEKEVEIIVLDFENHQIGLSEKNLLPKPPHIIEAEKKKKEQEEKENQKDESKNDTTKNEENKPKSSKSKSSKSKE